MHKAVLSARLSACAAVVLLMTATIETAHAQRQTFEYTGRGEWAQRGGATTQAAPAPTLDRVERLLQNNQSRQAEKLVIRWLLANRRHPQWDRGLYLTAQSQFRYGNRIKAFYYLDQLLDEYPESRYFQPALELQYEIADRFLRGYRRRFFGVPAFGAQDEAIEMLYRIQQRSPGSQLAERALLRTANFYYDRQDYDFAADTYAAYLRTYPRSPEVNRIKLRYAYSLYAQFRGPRFDATPLIDAREQLREVVLLYPDLAREENVPALVQQLDRNLARKLYVAGDFYRRTNEPRGAAYTFRYLTTAYPDTPEAQRAQRELSRLPQWALNAIPDPAITPGYAPASPALDRPRMAPGGEPANVQDSLRVR